MKNCFGGFLSHYVNVDRITNEIVAMLPTTIDEQSGKFILPNNERDLTLFKLVE